MLSYFHSCQSGFSTFRLHGHLRDPRFQCGTGASPHEYRDTGGVKTETLRTGKSPFRMGKSTTSMGHGFNSYVELLDGTHTLL